MATRLLPPGYQQLDANGAPVSGAKLYTYSAGTTTPKATYSDAGLTILNANPVEADAAGRFGDIFAATGSYALVMETSAGAPIWDADPVDGATGSTASPGAGVRNLLTDGDFATVALLTTTGVDGASIADDWYALNQSNNTTVSLQTLQQDGIPTNLRITQANATPQRFGFGKVVPAADTYRARGGPVTLSGKIRHSLAAPIRYAVLAWTGTADAPTKDVVNDWTSASYTAGGFFNSTTLTVVGVGSVTPTAATWTDITALTGTVSSSATNLVVMIWTEGTTAQNATLDVTQVQLEVAASATSYEFLPTWLAVDAPRYPNLCVNGAFDFWQASTSLSISASTTATASIYAADQWCMETSANQACTISRQTGTGQARYRARVQRNSGQTGTAVLRFQQPFETADCYAMRGQFVTVTFLAAKGADFSGSLRVKLLVGTGSEGRRTNAAAYTTETEPLDGAVTLNAVDGQFTFTSSVVIPTTTTQAALVFEWKPSGTAGTNDYFEVQDVYLRLGGPTVATFPRESQAAGLARCQRFYTVLAADMRYQNWNTAGQVLTHIVHFPTTMRTTPSVATSAASSSNLSGLFYTPKPDFVVLTSNFVANGPAEWVLNAVTASARL